MLLAFVLSSALAVSAVLGRLPGPTPTQVTYVEEEQIQSQIDESEQIVAVNDRSSNLKYVMAIQSSSIWTDIKQRSLTINSPQRLDDAVTGRSPDDLSDEELAQLKQACHDGLKCVAVDQLLVLKQVREPLGDGNTSVRMAITKITQVISEYTNEYHEDVYEYEAVTQSDDPSKVYESVTNIVEDNKELCQIDIVSAADKREGNATELPKESNDVDARPTTVVNNNNTVNFNTTKNYNVNNGTINNATVNMEAPAWADSATVNVSTDDGPAERQSENRSPGNGDQRPTERTDADTGRSPVAVSPAGYESSAVEVAKNGKADERFRPNIALANDSRPPAQLMITDAPRDDSTDGTAGGREALRPRPDGALEPVAYDNAPVSDSPNADGGNLGRDTDDAHRNTVTTQNGAGGGTGESDSDADIVSAGSHNTEDVKKGLVEDGYFNNGNMKVKNFDRSNRNKGTIKNSTADHGILNVGTVNNGPVNYGTANTYTNDGVVEDIRNIDIQEYATSIDKMYSMILNKLAQN